MMEELKKDTFLSGIGIKYAGRIQKIKKGNNKLQAIFEAFTNSLEAISSIKINQSQIDNGTITLKFFFTKDLLGNKLDFQSLHIEDTGIGFNDANFQRMFNLDDDSKNFKNKGTGRVQYLHFFDTAEYTSTYKDPSSQTGFKERKFKLSKRFFKNNAIIKHIDTIDIQANECKTTLTLSGLLNSNDESFYNELDIKEIKNELIIHYLMNFCSRRDDLPQIKLQEYIENKQIREFTIKKDDIPQIDNEQMIKIAYSKMSLDKKDIEKTEDKANFEIKSFKINDDFLKGNYIKLTSKGEVLESRIQLEYLKKDEHIEHKRYLFLVSSDFIDKKVEDTRGDVKILNKKEFKEIYKEESFFDEPEIVIEDIQEKINKVVLSMYDEIRKRNEKKEARIEKLRKMFLINRETVKSANININDTETTILEKIYSIEAKLIAKHNVEMKKHIEKIEQLDTTSDDYYKNLEEEVNKLVESIPLQNRNALTQYVARRKLVLELFDKILAKKLEIQKTSERNIDEKLLHNLIFQQSSDNPEQSDLWLISEDFIYFKGQSEENIANISIEGDKILKNTLSEEETKYRLKQEGDANLKRPDILLFPAEQKCIIIEFKSPKVNISEHLNQINRYASLINNLSKDKFNFTTYYGYLIGQNIDIDDIEDNDSDFKSAHDLDFIFRPYKRIVGKFGHKDGSLYTEIIKYSTLLERARRRNEIFIAKLDNTKLS